MSFGVDSCPRTAKGWFKGAAIQETGFGFVPSTLARVFVKHDGAITKGCSLNNATVCSASRRITKPTS